METKKRTLLENLRLRTKSPKKPQKKPLALQGRRMAAHRRSISVPDLTLVPGEAFSTDSVSTTSDSIYFGTSPGHSDTDSLASVSTTDGSVFMEKLSDPGTQTSSTSPLYAQVDKRAKRNVRKFTFEHLPAPRSVYPNLPMSEKAESVSLPGEDRSPVPFSSAAPPRLTRTTSQGDESSLNSDKSTTSMEQKLQSSEKDTPPPVRSLSDRTSLDAPLESADGTSLESVTGTSSEEQHGVPWSTEWEEMSQDPCSPLQMKEFSMEEGLLDFPHPDESLEEFCPEAVDAFDENALYPLETLESLTPGPDAQTPAPFQRYLLNINLKEGRNLVVRDKRCATIDPYVKFKLEGKQFYKSKVVYKNVNPRWDESFAHPLRDREHIVEVRVYDKNRTADEFMGSSFISLKDIELNKTYEMELNLDDPKSKEYYMGVILVDICLMHRDATIKRGPRFLQRKNKQNQAVPSRPAESPKNQLKNQMWTGVYRITVAEGQDLPQYGQGDVYVRFRLSDQKYKSKNLCIQPNPQWREQFDFNKFEDKQELLQVEVCSKRGRKAEESWGMFEVDLSRLPPNERQIYTHVLDPGKGRLVVLVSLVPCWGVSVSEMETATMTNPEEKDKVLNKYNLGNTHKCVGDVGLLQVGVIRANDLAAADINGKSNPVCVAELGNCRLQTHTVHKTTNPEWNKALTFPIKDIHDVLELTVFDNNGDKSPSFLGKVAIPLLSVQNGQQVCLLLKKEDLGRTAKGTITLVLEVIYNKVRAGIRSFQPKEAKLIEENVKFNKKVLARNIYRVRKISTAVLYTLQYIKSCFHWESTQRSLIAFLIFLVTVWHWEFFMLPLFLLLLIGWNYFQLSTGRASSNQDLVNMTMGDDEEEDEKESGKKGLMDKIHMVQEVVLVVQTVLEEIANIGERIKNIFNWSVPFLSCLACLMLFAGATLLYFVQLRYIVLIWGINKFTKRLRNPYAIDNNELLDFLMRAPSDVQKVQYSAQRAPTSQNQPRKKK
ncbi:multiple C2 and transmembrane domain-containing protein 2 [Cololabis saira]|uniref:multiple C2 and transmembrane domain-containing protein 2 n=1 Tax=Cololabis saira TaxID=129043 RepID=UPI002AD213B6|nr:multiple C2 and transmembrane domain-containing protein 2 [Cololabis saira]XP_061577882.1 multiple C2 and transmembrane domain-containing protein 2 [Cololabis saira]